LHGMQEKINERLIKIKTHSQAESEPYSMKRKILGRTETAACAQVS